MKRNPASPRSLPGSSLLAIGTSRRPRRALPAGPSEDNPPVLVKAAVPPVIDGVLDDAAWASRAQVRRLQDLQARLRQGRHPEQTEAYIAYDAENFYFAFRCFDSEPAKIKAAVCQARRRLRQRRLRLHQPRHLQRPAERLRLHASIPLGIQGDGMLNVQTATATTSFDAVWYSKPAAIDDKGCTVEMPHPASRASAIPNKDVLTMARRCSSAVITRTSEQAQLPAASIPNAARILAQAQPVAVSRASSTSALVELLPAVTFGRTRTRPAAKAGSCSTRAATSATSA
ncbi:MAG: hypothetical protein M0C28_45000 [Candidatus Moduliflexus flocculans]|nr:hypothetical protein [Candidatus Moduliflexus flocculans]